MTMRYDVWYVLAVILLNVFGIFNLLGLRPDLVATTLVFQLAGIVLFILFSRIKVELLEHNYKIIFLFFTALLVVTMFTPSIRGSHRWIDLGFFQLQTSEFFKPFFILCIAAALSASNRFSRIKVFSVIAMMIVPSFLIFVQPDLGTAIVYVATFALMFYFSGFSSRLAVYIGLAIAAIMPVFWHFLRPYQQARILGFLNPDLDPRGITYNITQAIIAIGSGGLLGKGLGLGLQSQYRFLPEFHTDFAFAAFIEQFGFVGGMFLILIYMLLFYRLIKKMFESKHNGFKFLFLVGTIGMLFVEAVVNIGMNLA
ncbi:MAG: Rod shape-determining protein RodA [Microgenomates bacterium OLB23]|nr:MAG: Rod shape-determining protein RodA [Microgenomates bacterium OLB23]